MTVEAALGFFAKYLWPLLLAWNIYLYRQGQATRAMITEDRLTIAKEYTSKNDLEKMFTDFETRMDKRLSDLIRVCTSK